MKPNLLSSRKFWVMVLNVVFSTVLYFTAKYAAPILADDIKWVIAAYQPVIMMVIYSYTVENTTAMKALPTEPPQ